jgi:hypothetical protein
MKQAKTLTAAELRRVTDSIATRAHPTLFPNWGLTLMIACNENNFLYFTQA